MNIPTFTFQYSIKVNLFNGYAVEVDGFGIIHTDTKNSTLPEETILALIQLGIVLRPICERMLSNGYIFLDGKLVKPEQLKQKV